jgi:hypothetical protein
LADLLDDLCVEWVFALVCVFACVLDFDFAELLCVAAGFAVASFAWRAFNSWAWLSTAAALAGSVLIVTPPLVPWAFAPAVAKDIRRTRPILFMLASRSC